MNRTVIVFLSLAASVCLVFAFQPSLLDSMRTAAQDRAQCQVPGGGYLANSGFEEGDHNLPGWSLSPSGRAALSSVTGNIADGWSDQSDPTQTTVQYSLVTEGSHTGHQCQQISVLSGNREAPADFAQVHRVPTGYFRASAWVRAAEKTAVLLIIRPGDGPPDFYQRFVVGSSWQRLEVDGNLPSTSDTDFVIEVPRATTVWVDDTSFDSALDPAYLPAIIAVVIVAGITAVVVFYLRFRKTCAP